MEREMSLPVLVTGAAGFIGFSLARRLLESGRSVVGLDSLNRYYEPALKEAGLPVLRELKAFSFRRTRSRRPYCRRAVVPRR